MKRKNACNEKLSTINIIHNCLELSKNNDCLLGNISFKLFHKQMYEGLWLIMMVCIYDAIKLSIISYNKMAHERHHCTA